MNSPDIGPLPPNAPGWCQAPFDPEGILSSVMAVVTCMIGLHFGHIIVHIKDHKARIISWTNPAAGLVVAGYALDFCGMHINKALYSLIYTCVTVGAAGLLFVAIYVMVDVFGFRKPTLVFEWMGKHALVIYILAACSVFPILVQGFYWKEPGNNFLRLIGRGYGRQDTYVLTKAMREMMINSMRGDIPVAIIRPSVVESTYKEPFPGWMEGNRLLVDPKRVLDVDSTDKICDMVVNACSRRQVPRRGIEISCWSPFVVLAKQGLML
ncbi:hypothetical protein C5167_043710 [Papaver somniferum]|uniref:Thioester reductase (TE) domain-containing protein n=1 Tax=Papaver somniferum TaxID=3469 RepID=A0A4Y7L7G0_PAPSO|nr:hypothetical protein C5167_043710 [Papaver somniferum]